MSDFDQFVEFVQYTKRFRNVGVGPRRYLRDYSDPFSKYSVEEFHARYRFTPDVVKSVILPMLESIRKPSKRGLPFPPEIMLLITLRYYATGSFQKMQKDVMNICQQSVSRIIVQVSNLIAKKMKKYVKFPTTTEGLNMVKQKFYEISHFPEVIGCIDCTHIKIRSPGGNTSEVYKNRKGFFSINVQTVVGPNLEFFNLVARWPGSTPDNFIYNNSSIKQRLDTGELEGVILGDSDFAMSNTILTPFLSPNSIPQEQYNKSHNETRKIVEHCLGIWKGRFPCLQVGMCIKVETVVAVICACAALHNIAVSVGDIAPTNWEMAEIDNDVDITICNEDPNSDGFVARQLFVDRYFQNC
ncbi:putative nuclease HARBI1 [Papilio machaon]|uniref:putative nuclease HARBI1 n=1 Tax=Papilio machaon TaxID=76193 RepID=UPI001E6644A9|nr:putative nuclease HARBI1 [Papilio machaon]